MALYEFSKTYFTILKGQSSTNRGTEGSFLINISVLYKGSEHNIGDFRLGELRIILGRDHVDYKQIVNDSHKESTADFPIRITSTVTYTYKDFATWMKRYSQAYNWSYLLKDNDGNV